MHQPRRGTFERLGQRVGRFLDEYQFEIHLLMLIVLSVFLWICYPEFRVYEIWGFIGLAVLLFIIALVFFPWVFIAILVVLVAVSFSWRVKKTMQNTEWGKKDGT